jgi:hypothetical protein
MIYVDFTAGNEEYKLRLNTRQTIALEKLLGCNPLGIFKDDGTLPTVEQMVCVLYASLQQLNHGITKEKAMDIFDAYLDDGHTAIEFFAVIVEIYKASGLIPADTKEQGKN